LSLQQDRPRYEDLEGSLIASLDERPAALTRTKDVGSDMIRGNEYRFVDFAFGRVSGYSRRGTCEEPLTLNERNGRIVWFCAAARQTRAPKAKCRPSRTCGSGNPAKRNVDVVIDASGQDASKTSIDSPRGSLNRWQCYDAAEERRYPPDSFSMAHDGSGPRMARSKRAMQMPPIVSGDV